MQRIDLVKGLSDLLTPDDLCLSSIGGLLDDWWNYRPNGSDNSFFVGILGSVSSTAMGLAFALPGRRVIALETDGSILMNTGVMCTLGNERPPNLTVIVFDNTIYENIGGLPTHTSRNTDLHRMAEGAGCEPSASTADLDTCLDLARTYLDDDGFGFLVARLEPGVHPWPREERKPTDGVEDKYRFLRYVEQLEDVVVHPGQVQN